MTPSDSDNPDVSVDASDHQQREISNDDSGSAVVSLSVEQISRNRNLEVLLNENSILRHVLVFMPIGFCMFDQKDRLQLCNQQFVDVWNLPSQVCQQGTHFNDIMVHSHGEEVSFSGEQLGKAGQKRREWLTDDGRRIDVLVHVLSEGTVLALHEDVTDKRAAEQHIAHLAKFDALTNLYNRAMLYQKLEETLAADIVGTTALLYLDLNGFKQVNDTLGHPVGDKLLMLVARRIKSCCRESTMVARVGGDEFAILMTELDSAQGAGKLSQRIIDSLTKPFDIDGRSIYTSTSIGIATISEPGASAEEIVQRSDMALYEAKAAGGAVYRHYVDAMANNARTRQTLEADLRNAIQNDEFELYYQPQIDLQTMRICAAEALIRWNHPVQGLIEPEAFIPAAEKTGLIIAIGNWVLQAACKEAMSWPEDIRVAVNVASFQFGNSGMQDVDLHGEVVLALQQAKLPAPRLELEMTEIAIMDDVDKTGAVLSELKKLGVTIAIDDFGTGFFSLQHLRSFRVDHLKIDRSFVTHMESDADALAIAKSIVVLGNNLGVSSTAEGIETQAQFEMIKEMGCNKGQGYYFAKPCSGVEFLSFVENYSLSATGKMTCSR